MNRHYQLKVTSDTTNIDVDSIDADEVARIVQLAGVIQKPTDSAVLPATDPMASMPMTAMPTNMSMDPISSDQSNLDLDTSVDPMSISAPDTSMSFDDNIDTDTCAICGENGHDEHSCPQSVTADPASIDTVADMENEIDEEMAEFDLAYNDIDSAGKEIDQDDFIWQGPKLPQRVVKGNMGDNALISELHEHLQTEYQKYLEEAERENDDGILSPLSDVTKPEFDKDSFANKTPDDDGSNSPMSTIIRQSVK